MQMSSFRYASDGLSDAYPPLARHRAASGDNDLLLAKPRKLRDLRAAVAQLFGTLAP